MFSSLIVLALLLVALPAAANPAANPAADVGAEVDALRHTVAEQQERLDELERRLEAPRAGAALSEEGGGSPPAPTRLQGHMVAAFARWEETPATFDQEEFSPYFNSPLSDRLSVFAELEFFHDRRRVDPATGKVDYRLSVANGRGRDPDRRDANFRKAYGGRLAVRPTPSLRVGVSLLDDADDRFDDAHETNLGADFRWRFDRLEVKGEGVTP